MSAELPKYVSEAVQCCFWRKSSGIAGSVGGGSPASVLLAGDGFGRRRVLESENDGSGQGRRQRRDGGDGEEDLHVEAIDEEAEHRRGDGAPEHDADCDYREALADRALPSEALGQR